MGTNPKVPYRSWKPGDPTPLCLCGCGQPVKFERGDNRGRPRNYVFGHHPHNIGVALNHKRTEEIALGPFRDKVLQIMDEKGLDNTAAAAICGMHPGHFRSLIYKKGTKGVKVSTVTLVLRRLAGLPTEPTTWERSTGFRAREQLYRKFEQSTARYYGRENNG